MTFVDRVNSWWKGELDTLKVERREQFMDLTEYLRLFARANCRGEVGHCQDDKSIFRSWLEGVDDDVSRFELLCGNIRCLADRYPVSEKGTVVVKVHDGFDYDSYITEKFSYVRGAALPSYLKECALGVSEGGSCGFRGFCYIRKLLELSLGWSA